MIPMPSGYVDDSIAVAVGKYLMFEDPRERRRNYAGQVVISQESPGTFCISTELPGDKILYEGGFKFNNSNKQKGVMLPNGHGSILRFKENVKDFFPSIAISSDDADPLCFVLLRESGLTYVCGKGTVTTKDGRITTFPVKNGDAPINAKTK